VKLLAKFSVLVFIVLFVSVSGHAQVKLVNGFLRDSVTLFPISSGIITNSTTKKTVKTDDKGFFRIEASPNDFIYASAKSYHFDTLKYSLMFTDTVTIFLSFAGNVLPVVTVKGQYSKYQLDSIERRKEFEESRGTVLKTLGTDHPSGFGLTFNLDKVFKKKYRSQTSNEKVFTTLEKTAYIDYRFSPNLVAYYTGLKGEKLKDFINYCSPSFEWLRAHPANEDVLYYINDKLKEYKVRKTK
jgi:hypothetical protein